jgi:hypothetical protein
MLALVPPVGVAFATNSLEFLVGITGSYAGAGIQVKTATRLDYFMIEIFSYEGWLIGSENCTFWFDIDLIIK